MKRYSKKTIIAVFLILIVSIIFILLLGVLLKDNSINNSSNIIQRFNADISSSVKTKNTSQYAFWNDGIFTKYQINTQYGPINKIIRYTEKKYKDKEWKIDDWKDGLETKGTLYLIYCFGINDALKNATDNAPLFAIYDFYGYTINNGKKTQISSNLKIAAGSSIYKNNLNIFSPTTTKDLGFYYKGWQKPYTSNGGWFYSNTGSVSEGYGWLDYYSVGYFLSKNIFDKQMNPFSILKIKGNLNWKYKNISSLKIDDLKIGSIILKLNIKVSLEHDFLPNSSDGKKYDYLNFKFPEEVGDWMNPYKYPDNKNSIIGDFLSSNKLSLQIFLG